MSLASLLYRQWTLYTCGTTVFRSIVRKFTDVHYTENQAIELVGTTKDGTTFPQIIRSLRTEGVSVGKLKPVSKRNIDKALSNDRWVVVADYNTWMNVHVFIVTGECMGMYWVLDPLIGFPVLYTKSYVTKTARGEGFSVYKR